MTQFFKKFPIVDYGGVPAINLLSRVNMSKLALNNKQAFYDYVMNNNERLDSISYNYYKDSDYTWLISLSNSIIDPYYDVPLSDEDLNKLIAIKYGSISAAQQKIVFFRTNGLGDESNITTAAYAALSIGQQKYWSPVSRSESNYNSKIIEYVRSQEELIVTTNKVIGLELSAATGAFNDGELLKISGDIVAELAYSTTSYATIRHVAGDISEGDVIEGYTSGETATVDSVTTITQNIPNDELIYWDAINAYDYEHELNNKKTNLKLLGNQFASVAQTQLKDLFL